MWVRGSLILGSVVVDELSCNSTKYTNLLDQPLIVRLYFCDKVLSYLAKLVGQDCLEFDCRNVP